MYPSLPLDEPLHRKDTLSPPSSIFSLDYLPSTSYISSLPPCSIHQKWHGRFYRSLAPLREINRFTSKEGLSRNFHSSTYLTSVKQPSKLRSQSVTPISAARATPRLRKSTHPPSPQATLAFAYGSAFSRRVLSSRTGPSVLSLVRLVRKLYRDQISPIQGFVNYSIAKPDREIQSRLLSSEARQPPVRDRSRVRGDLPTL